MHPIHPAYALFPLAYLLVKEFRNEEYFQATMTLLLCIATVWASCA